MKTEAQIRSRLEQLERRLGQVADQPMLQSMYLREIDLLEWVLEK
jgi:hypothetical protein